MERAFPDLIGPGVRLLFVGINPGACGPQPPRPFAHPWNRFYPALLAGILDRDLDPRRRNDVLSAPPID